MLVTIRVKTKGGPGSGNWGHAGRKGQRGGSIPRDSGMSIASGSTWLERYETVKGKPHPYALELKKERETREKQDASLKKYAARMREGELSHKEVAKRLGMTEDAVKSRIRDLDTEKTVEAIRTGKLSIKQAAVHLSMDEAKVKAIAGDTGKRSYTRSPERDRSGDFDFYSVNAESGMKFKKKDTELPGQMVIDPATGKMAVAMNYTKNAARADYQDIAYYGGMKKPGAHVRISRASTRDRWVVDSPGTGNLFGLKASQAAVGNMKKTAQHLLDVGFDGNALVQMTVGNRVVTQSISDWISANITVF